MASDRLALDPLAGSGDPMERLIARVSELERQITNVGTGQRASGTVAATETLSGLAATGPRVSLLLPAYTTVLVSAAAEANPGAGTSAGLGIYLTNPAGVGHANGINSTVPSNTWSPVVLTRPANSVVTTWLNFSHPWTYYAQDPGQYTFEVFYMGSADYRNRTITVAAI